MTLLDDIRALRREFGWHPTGSPCGCDRCRAGRLLERCEAEIGRLLFEVARKGKRTASE